VAAPFLLADATSPLAIATAHHLARLGHDVVALAREPARATGLPHGTHVLEVDLSDPATIDRLDLPAVAGVMHLGGILRVGAEPVPFGWRDGPGHVDRTWATNVLGPLRLVRRLLPRLPAGAPVALISSSAHRRAPLHDADFATVGLRASREATTATLLWTRALARRRPDLVATAFCPGWVVSRRHEDLPWPLSWLGALAALTARDARDIAPQLAPLLLHGHPSGTYLEAGAPRPPAAHTDDVALQDAVWARATAWAPQGS
jgi:NAD(P)-dependent dehydrogenase (short-subunit alcohol dehydrogenase family)